MGPVDLPVGGGGGGGGIRLPVGMRCVAVGNVVGGGGGGGIKLPLMIMGPASCTTGVVGSGCVAAPASGLGSGAIKLPVCIGFSWQA